MNLLDQPETMPTDHTKMATTITRWQESHARILSLLHVGADGWLKTLDFIPRSLEHLQQILEIGERADGSSLFARSGIKTASSDVLLSPKPESAFLNPFAKIPTLCILCGHTTRSGNPLPQSPDTIIRRAVNHLKSETDHELWAHGEIEFFLGYHPEAHQNDGRSERGYHATAPIAQGEELRREACLILADMGIPIKYAHSEVGYIESDATNTLRWEQHEIELDLCPLPAAADAVVLTQWVLRNLAAKYAMRCSMEPIVVQDHAGNGLHFHLSPRHQNLPTPVGSNAANLSPPARWLIAGLTHLGAALMAFGNRSPHSFTRLQQGQEVPKQIKWGNSDRSALVRLPAVPLHPDGTPALTPTIEFRLADGSAHPHLLLAGIAQSMVYGCHLENLNQHLAQSNAEGNSSDSNTAAILPTGPSEIADALENQIEALTDGAVFTPSFLKTLIAELRNPPSPSANG